MSCLTTNSLTRRIRSKFRKADEFEAAVHCSVPSSDDKEEKDAPQDDSTKDEDKLPQPDDLEENVGVAMPTTRSIDHPGLQFLTWRMPAGLNFSYSSVPVRSHLHRAPPHKPNPFSQAARNQRVQSPDVAQWRKTVGPLESSQILNQDDPPITKAEKDAQEQEAPKAIVTVHAKKQPWDDRPRLDRPYVNPYYATPLDNFLWLPLNPFTLLDLDESADLHRALTSELHTGKLGVWLNDTPTIVGNVVTINGADTPGNGTVRREISGRETIVGLPDDIARRARTELDIDDAEGAQLTMGRGGTIRLRATAHARHRQAEEHDRPRVYVEVDARRPGGESIVSARDAVLGEILVEEQLATEERLRREHAEEQQARGSRLWAWTRG